MTVLGPDHFPAFFKAVHGYDPFPWQTRLAKQLVETGCWPTLLDLPTGAGKTAAIDIAVFHLACEADCGPERRAPLRILFVIDRRIVVDAAAERARKIVEALHSPMDEVVAEVARRLSLLSGDDEHPLDVVRLRGGAPQERDWARSPAQPLVAVSTVDQVGSRLLFRGYGVSPRMWPVHAGLVGADALWLLDEVHLSHPLEQTLDAIEAGHPVVERSGILAERPRLSPFAVVRLSATPGEKIGEVFSLTDDDRNYAQLQPRLAARKIASLIAIDDKPEDVFAEHVLRLTGLITADSTGKGRRKKGETSVAIALPARVAVVVNRVDAARRVFDKIGQHLRKIDREVGLVLLTGRVRPLDRERIIDRIKDLKLLADPDRGDSDKPVILVATQTIEAGADLDVDTLVTEIAPLDCLRQRFGRLDRLGKRGQSQAVILHPKGRPSKDNDWAPIGRIYDEAAYETKEWLAGLGGEIDFGIDAFAARFREIEAEPDKLKKLLALRADAPMLLPAYADLWATTSPPPSATPEPALFLHGPGTSTDVQIVWRADVDPRDVDRANKSLECCPPSSLEALPVPVWAARKWLRGDKAEAGFADVPEQSPEQRDDQVASDRSSLRRDGDRWKQINAEDVKAGDVIVVPAGYGGCDQFGWNPESKDDVVDLGTEAHYLQRLKGALRLTREMLANALRREHREDETDAIWNVISRALPGEDEEAGAAEARDVVEALLESELALPKSWQALIEGRDGHKGIRDRRPSIAPFGATDWSKGCGLYADKLLDAGLLHDDTEDEPDGTEAITERDDSSRIGDMVPLADHLAHVLKKARAFGASAGLDGRMVELIALAARLHDLGKADPRFQADLHGASALVRLGLTELQLGELLAKSARGEGRRTGVRAVPENFRHEAMSVALAEKHPAVVALPEEERDLVLWLIGTHHGFGRPFFPPCNDPMPDMEADVKDMPSAGITAPLRAAVRDAPLRLNQGWFERAERVRWRFGPWELARLEAILRLADHVASAEEQNGAAPGPKAAAKEEAVS